MRGDRCIWVAGFVVVALLAAGCSGEEPSTPAAPAPPTALPESPTPEPTPSTDPYAIPADPADIDEAYVERVLEALSESTAAAARVVAEKGRVTRDARAHLASAYRRGPSLDGVIRAFTRAARQQGQDVFSPTATSITFDVVDLVSADSECVFAEVMQDTSGLGQQEIEPFPGYLHIEPKRPDEDPKSQNPTPWMVVAEVGEAPPGKEYENPCA